MYAAMARVWITLGWRISLRDSDFFLFELTEALQQLIDI